MGIHEGKTGRQDILTDYGVWVEQQDILASSRLDGNIVSTGKTKIVVSGYNLYRGETLTQKLHGAIM